MPREVTLDAFPRRDGQILPLRRGSVTLVADFENTTVELRR